MASAYLFVDKPVASLQCDIETTGNAALMTDASANKMMQTNRLSNGKLRIVVFGLGQEIFTGRFARIDAAVVGISNIVTANPDATDAGAVVLKLSSPGGLTLAITF